MQFKGIDIEKIMEIYKQGKSFEYIIEKFNLDSSDFLDLRKAIHKYIQKNEEYDTMTKRIKLISPEELYNYKKETNLPNSQIGYSYDITPVAVSQIMVKFYRENNLEPLKKKDYSKLPINKIIQEYKNGTTITDLAKKYEVNSHTLATYISKEMDPNDYYFAKKNNKQHLYSKAKNIKEYYEDGMTIDEIAASYNTTKTSITNILRWTYSQEDKRMPKVLSKEKLLQYKESGMNIKDIKEALNSRNIIIPEKYINEVFEVQFDMKKIRKFITNKAKEDELDDEKRKALINNTNTCNYLKENGYSLEYQVVALLHNLPTITNTSDSEILTLLDGNSKMLDTIHIINSENDKDYLTKLSKNEVARDVKLATIIEEIYQANISNTKLENGKYLEYLPLIKKYNLRRDFIESLQKNNNISTQETYKTQDYDKTI